MDSDVQKIKDRINIVDVVGQYIQLRRAGRNYTARCPFHKERTPSFMVSPERGTYMCFGCGEKGDIFSFIQKMDGVDFPTVLKQLAEKAGIKLERRAGKAPETKEKEERLREVCEAAAIFFEAELQKRKDVQDYLHTRGLKPETSLSWRIGYAPASWDQLSLHLKSVGFSNEEIVDAGFAVKSEKKQGDIFDRFRGRIMFPIFDVAGAPIAVSGRFFEKVPGQKEDGEPAKYVNSPETLIFKKARTLYGLDRARTYIRKADCILLVEGQFDLLLSHQSGLPFAVALSGTALTPEHLSILSRLSKRLVLALDADQAGLRAGLKSAHMALGAGFDVKIPTFPAGKDPADIAKENPELLKAAVRTSQTAIEFFLNALWPQAQDDRAYNKLVEAHVLPLVAALQSRIDQEHFIHTTAGRLSVPDSAVREEVNKIAGRTTPAPEETSPEVHHGGAESNLSSLELKIGMALAGWEGSKAKVQELLGADFERTTARLKPFEEELKFRFEREVHEETTAERVAQDMLVHVEAALKRAKMKSV